MGFGNRFSLMYLDGLDFFKRNIGIFVALFVFFAGGVVIGVWCGVIAGSDMYVILRFDGRLMDIIIGEMSFVKYLFWLLFECALILVVMFVFSLHYYASFLIYVVILYKGYLLAFNSVILIVSAKLSCLVFLFFCYIPFSLAIIFCFCCIAASSIKKSSHGFLSGYMPKITEIVSPCFPIFAAMVGLCFLQSLLTFVLADGIFFIA